jgi:hypothetical protein
MAQRLLFSDFEYKGVFRLPDTSGGSSWEYAGYAMTYYPGGDPSGPSDGYPGSLYALGHDHHQLISEISIPVPIISASKNTSELNTATTLQVFSDITNDLFGDLEIPRAGIAYLPAQGDQTSGKLHFCWGQHFQNFEPSHGWCELDLLNPETAGPWHFGPYTNYVTNDFLFDIPQAWASLNTPGQMLVSGRFRDGHWGGLGPALFAYGPWNDGTPPASNATLSSITPLLLYGTQEAGGIEITLSDTMKMTGFKEADEWSGGAWLTSGTQSAVLLAGTKATGNCWYGFANGVVYPTDSDATEFPDVPDWPYDDRGWWSEEINGQFMLFDTDELAKVAAGTLNTYDPQPYATLNIDSYLYDPGFDLNQGKRYLLGGICFDRENGLLYVFERNADDDKGLIHVWQLKKTDETSDIHIKGLQVTSADSLQVGSPVSITVNAVSPSDRDIYYKFYYCANYGTDEYETTAWTVIQDYSTSSFAQHTFTETGNYVIVVRVVADPSSEPAAVPIIGQAIAIGSSDHLNVSNFAFNTSANPGIGDVISLTATAAAGVDDIVYYRFDYRSHYGESDYNSTAWTMIQDYSTSNTASYTFTEAGKYVIVARAVTDPGNEPAALPIFGTTLTINP